MSEPSTHDQRGFFGHPRGLSTLFFTEIWERFSFYGMKAMLFLFIIQEVAQGPQSGLGIDEATGGAIAGLYNSGVCLLALPGGWWRVCSSAPTTSSSRCSGFSSGSATEPAEPPPRPPGPSQPFSPRGISITSEPSPTASAWIPTRLRLPSIVATSWRSLPSAWVFTPRPKMATAEPRAMPERPS